MRTRTDYWYNSQRHPIKLSSYALALLKQQQPSSYSVAISAALQDFLSSQEPMIAAATFIEAHEGMNLSLLIEAAVIWKYHRP